MTEPPAATAAPRRRPAAGAGGSTPGDTTTGDSTTGDSTIGGSTTGAAGTPPAAGDLQPEAQAGAPATGPGSSPRRDALLDAAERVLSTRGLDRATVADITAEAGVAKGTFYLYFSSKDEVITAVQQRLFRSLVDQTLAALAAMADGEWWEQVDAFVAQVVDFDIAHREWHRVLARSWESRSAVPETEHAQLLDLVTAAIRLGVDQGVAATDDIEMTALLLHDALESTLHRLCAEDGPIDRDRVVAAAQSLVRKALAPA